MSWKPGLFNYKSVVYRPGVYKPGQRVVYTQTGIDCDLQKGIKWQA